MSPVADLAPSSEPSTPLPAKAAKRRSRTIARKVFGFEELHAAQEEAIAQVLSGRDTLAVMPTGFGKSAIYQIAALTLGGAALVVSPLIALQKDQTDALEARGLRSSVLNSTLSSVEREAVLSAFEAGELAFVFLAPEQLANAQTLERLKRAPIRLFVVDEAHCVAEWGHDFRPDYLELGTAIEALGHPTVLALTATAAPPTRTEILERLNMHNPAVLVRGFDRPELWFGVERFSSPEAKRAGLLEYVQEAQKPGIVYCATRKGSDEVAALLGSRGVRARAYHAGMKAPEREAVQEAFKADALEVIVATSAFGMGVDKPNVRFVAHHDLSGSIDAYYQEVGRAGRDGEEAEAVLFFAEDDLKLRRFFASGAGLERDLLESVLEALSQGPLGFSDLQEKTGLDTSPLERALRALTDVEAVSTLGGGELALVADDVEDAALEAARSSGRQRQFERSRLEMMRGYIETESCRREYLLNYFGESLGGPCGDCDTCEAGLEEHPGALEDAPFALGARVRHKTLGPAQVMRLEEGKITLLFDELGYQTLSLAVVLEGGLLEILGG